MRIDVIVSKVMPDYAAQLYNRSFSDINTETTATLMIENNPVSQSQRLPIIDVLRGWALFSVAVMNYSTIHGWNNRHNDSAPRYWPDLLQNIFVTIFEVKGLTLLAILFGYGFSVLLKNISQSGRNPYIFFTKRMMWLFGFAFLNSMLFGGDILNDYAFMGLLLLLFYKFNAKTLYILAIIILIFTPVLQLVLGYYQLLFTPKYRDAFYELYQHNTIFKNVEANLYMRYKWMQRLSYSVILHLIQLGCFILGAAFHRSNFFENFSDKPTLFMKKIFIVSLVLSIVIFFTVQTEWIVNEYYNLYYPQVIIIMIFTSSGICWLYLSGLFKTLFDLIALTGRMTLTNYIVQNMIAFILFICIRPDWDWIWYFTTGIIVYVLQIFLSYWWFANFNFGFFEWLWRCLTYQKWFPLNKRPINSLDLSISQK